MQTPLTTKRGQTTVSHCDMERKSDGGRGEHTGGRERKKRSEKKGHMQREVVRDENPNESSSPSGQTVRLSRLLSLYSHSECVCVRVCVLPSN